MRRFLAILVFAIAARSLHTACRSSSLLAGADVAPARISRALWSVPHLTGPPRAALT